MSDTRFSEELLHQVKDLRLLLHPFYRAWDCGQLNSDLLATYGRQYYHHVAAFPRYLSATHSKCEDLKSRQALLRNLCDEEQGDENHPELWIRFAEGLGATREEIESEALLAETQELIETFKSLCGSSYAEGLAALFVYEEQTPDICVTKIKGLTEHYGVTDDRSLQYFRLHQGLDIEHTAESAALVDSLPEADREKAQKAATKAAAAMWRFLDGMERLRTSDLVAVH